GAAPLGSARLGSARLGAARLGAARLGSARCGAARRGAGGGWAIKAAGPGMVRGGKGRAIREMRMETSWKQAVDVRGEKVTLPV
ncbi:hypothetical protein, partial [Paractinoplanes abujensis]